MKLPPIFYVSYRGVMLACFGAWMLLRPRFTRLLKDFHPETYRQLGRPPVGWKRFYQMAEIPALFAETGYLISGRFRELGDAEVDRVGGWVRLLILAVPLLFVGWIGLVSLELSRQTEAHMTTQPQEASPEYEKWQRDKAIYDAFVAGQQFEKEGRFVDALEQFNHVLALDPDNFNACRHVDWLHARQGDWNAVIGVWDRYLQRNPDHAGAWLERGGAYFHQGDKAAARADAARACDLGLAEGCRRRDQLDRTTG